MRRVCRAGGYPTPIARIVSAPVVKIHAGETKDAAPNDHFGSGPNRAVRLARRRRIGDAGDEPAIVAWVVSAPSVAIVEGGIGAAPNNHFVAGPYRSVRDPSADIIGDARRRPSVGVRIVSAAAVQVAVSVTSVSAPDNHFATSPERCVTDSREGRVQSADGDP